MILLYLAIICNMYNKINSYKYNTNRILQKNRIFQMNRDDSPIRTILTKNHTKTYETLLNDCNDWDSGEVMWDFRDENRTRY
jgi:hypothetical protein